MPSSSPILLMIIFSIWLLISCTESTDYLVGDTENSWKFPLPSRNALTRWASTHEFTVGDTITFQYNNKTESVHEVEEDDYDRCRIKEDHVDHYDGNTKVVLKKTGIKHFISGRKRHCRLGLKLAVVVMAAAPIISPPPTSASPPSPRSTPIPHPRIRSPPSPPSPSPSPSESPSPSPLEFCSSPSKSPSPAPSPSPSPSESPLPSLSPSPSDSPTPPPNSSGSKGGDGCGFIMLLGISWMFLI